MKETLSGNIARYRREKGLTQEDVAGFLNITFQAVSKWETGQTMPDITLLPPLAKALGVSVDKLLGYSAFGGDLSCYEREYQKDEYFWGLNPSKMCLKVLEHMPPVRKLKLLDIGCGEGKDAVFFARCGYEVSAFDISDAGLDKLKRLAERACVPVRAFKANIWDFRLEEEYDVLFSSGTLHYIKPELRDEVMGNYKTHVRKQGIVSFHVFVDKPFIGPAPEKEYSYLWKSGELFTYFHDWYIESCSEYVFDCNSSGVAHRHAANRLLAVNN
ncbi:MAG: helix-turn-helix domain-containing protein [Oscillospiraceae bacterium]|jgi:tellurite methyltransferase|nr:helix-turn-helix domain-containing protein [Oscillospiraceae bacterium]